MIVQSTVKKFTETMFDKRKNRWVKYRGEKSPKLLSKSTNKGDKPVRKKLTTSEKKTRYLKQLALYKDYSLKVLNWLATFFERSIPIRPIHHLAVKLFTIAETRGKREAILYGKSIRTDIFNAIARLPDLASIKYVSLGDLPKPLRGVRNVDENQLYPLIRLLLSTTYITRYFLLPKETELSHIVDGPSNGYPLELSRYIHDFWLELRYHPNLFRQQPPLAVSFRQYHLSTKTGPNGQALASSVYDYTVLPDDLKESIRYCGGTILSKRMSIFEKYIEYILPVIPFVPKGTKRGVIRRLSSLQHPDGKTRVVAIGDYWSQTCLRPLHEYLFRVLRKIPQDCTFNQGSFIDKLPNTDEKYYSVDLTAATDRFPIQVIARVLEPILGKVYVKHWVNIMVGYPFKQGSNKNIRYGIGNPMGFYSSWNSFAVAHHYILYYCCRNIGMEWKTAPYVLLGDDICIKHQMLGEEYLRVVGLLGLKISEKKSHISPYGYEFAKRFIHNDLELTPFPVNALYEFRRNPVLALNLLEQESMKGWRHPLGALESFISLLEVLGKPGSYRSKKKLQLLPVYNILLMLQGKMSAREALEPILKTKLTDVAYQLFEKAHKERGDENSPYLNVIKNSVMNLFVKANDDGSSSAKPLGQTAMDLVINITSWDLKDSDTHQDIIECLPHTQIHGEIEETYLRIQREAYNIDTLYGGDWKLSLRALSIPVSDEIYIHRNKELKVTASGKLAEEVMLGIQPFNEFPQLI